MGSRFFGGMRGLGCHGLRNLGLRQQPKDPKRPMPLLPKLCLKAPSTGRALRGSGDLVIRVMGKVTIGISTYNLNQGTYNPKP